MATTTELMPAAPTPPSTSVPPNARATPSIELNELDSARETSDLPGPNARNVSEVKETWKYPRINTWRVAAIFFAFLNFGMNDACYGALMPYVSGSRVMKDWSRLTN